MSDTTQEVATTGVAQDRINSFIERVERVNEEIAGLTDDRKSIFAEAKAEGLDVKTLRQIIALRKKTRDERMEEEAMLELYMQAVGMV